MSDELTDEDYTVQEESDDPESEAGEDVEVELDDLVEWVHSLKACEPVPCPSFQEMTLDITEIYDWGTKEWRST